MSLRFQQRNVGWRRPLGTMLAICALLMPVSAAAHTLPFFNWFDVQREVTVGAEEVRVIHTARIDLTRLRGDDPLVDLDGDSTASEHEIADSCVMAARYLAQDFIPLIDGQPVSAMLDRFQVLDGTTGFRTELLFPLPEGGGRSQVGLFDPAYLMPVPAGTISETSGSVIRSTTESVTLLADSGDFVPSIPLRPQFSVVFTVQRPGTAVPHQPAPSGILDRLESAEKDTGIEKPAAAAGDSGKEDKG